MSAVRQRTEALLLRQAIGDLNEAENAELARLLAAHPDIDRDMFERAAATVLLAACADPQERMPASLRQKLKADASGAISRAD